MSVSQPAEFASAVAPQDSSPAPSLEPEEDDDPMVAYMKLAKKRRLAEKAADEAARAAFLASLRSSASAPETPTAPSPTNAATRVQDEKGEGHEPQLRRPQPQPQHQQQPKQSEEEIGDDAIVAFVKLSKKWKVKVEPRTCPEEEDTCPSKAPEVPVEGDTSKRKRSAQQDCGSDSLEEARQGGKEKHGKDIRDENKAEVKIEKVAKDGGTHQKDQDEVVVTYCNVTRKTRVKLEAAAEEVKKLHQGEGLHSSEEAQKSGEETKTAPENDLTKIAEDLKAEEQVKNEVTGEVKEEVKAELKTEQKSEIKEEVKAELK